ncbi:MAG: NADH-quinone oxidoreductase subunit C [Coriobacteriia bacterium]|nr:NADH-quinone oxidoreductase subunit C [Coriobacteriia bacterium]
MTTTFAATMASIAEKFKSAVLADSDGVADACIRVEREELLGLATELAAKGFDQLEMVTAVDYRDRIGLIYRLVSATLSASLVVRCDLPAEQPRVVSLAGIWPAADSQEREVLDLFGVAFDGHPCPKRIFLPDDFCGHPLRKDFESPTLIRRPDLI